MPASIAGVITPSTPSSCPHRTRYVVCENNGTRQLACTLCGIRIGAPWHADITARRGREHVVLTVRHAEAIAA